MAKNVVKRPAAMKTMKKPVAKNAAKKKPAPPPAAKSIPAVWAPKLVSNGPLVVLPYSLNFTCKN